MTPATPSSPAELQQLIRVARLYGVVNSAIEAILHAQSPADLYQRVCDASVLRSKFLATTVFEKAPGDMRLMGVASTGPGADTAIGLVISVDESLPQGRGMVGNAYRTRRPWVSNDILADERLRFWRDQAHRMGAHAVAALPLMQAGQSRAVLAYYAAERNEFDDETVSLLERVAANISFALDNFDREAARDRAEAATQRVARMYAALSATNEAIMRLSSPEALYKQVCDAGVSGGNFIGAAVLLPDEQGAWLNVAAVSGPAADLLHGARITTNAHLPEGQGPSSIAFHTQKSRACNDFLNDPITRPWHEGARAGGVAASAAVPFLHKGRTAGVLLCYSAEKNAFDEGILSLLERLAQNVAFALDNFAREAERQRAQERIHYLATHDELTGLPNRMMFGELLSAALQTARRYQRPLAVLFIDLDRFKAINDTLGHEAGDALLRTVSARFKQTLRASDVVARLGGDEFVVLAQEVRDPAEVTVVARKLLDAAAEPVMLSGQACQVSASVGIALYPTDGDNEQTLMKNADRAMYLAKERGKNNCQFYRPDPPAA